MIRGNNLNLAKIKGAQLVQKKAISVAVLFAQKEGVCKTKEGDVAYKAGDAMMTGVEGEQWPIERAKFDVTYEPIAPIHMSENGDYSKKPIPVYALQVDEPFYVEVSWADSRLEGESGDWLLQYGPDDYGIVSKSIFEKTYAIIIEI